MDSCFCTTLACSILSSSSPITMLSAWAPSALPFWYLSAAVLVCCTPIPSFAAASGHHTVFPSPPSLWPNQSRFYSPRLNRAYPHLNPSQWLCMLCNIHRVN